MTLQLNDTIVALASAPGSGGRGIVRISGADVKNVVSSHFTPADAARWESTRVAELHVGEWRLLIDSPWGDAPLRNGLRLPVAVCFWPTNRSYTGQALVELHLVSSPPLLEALLTQLTQTGCRAARPGEFTLRAFLAGRLDLLQAEAVLGVIDAADHEELELALRQLAGGISHQIAAFRSDLLDLLAELEAGLDFVEEDIEFVSRESLSRRIGDAQQKVAELCDQASRRLTSSSRPKVVLAGLPNAGKSTLLNALSGQSAALVSDVCGTTRDYLRVPFDRDGLNVDLIDTAGWDKAASGIDAVAQQMRDEQWQNAELIVWCSDLSADDRQREEDEQLFADVSRERHRLLRIGTKADRQSASIIASPSTIAVSATTRLGLDELCKRMRETLAIDTRGQRQLLGMTASRCQESLLGARAALRRTEDAISLGIGEDLIVIELRDVLEHLGHIVGAVYTDDVLDRIFSKFCIGK